MLPFRVLSVIACEDIRREVGGRHTLVGTVGTLLRVSSFPMEEVWDWFIEMIPSEIGEFVGEARLLGPNEAVLTHGGFEVSFTALKPILFVISSMQIQFQIAGQYEFQLKVGDDDDWETIKAFEVRERPPQRSSTPPTT